LLFCGGSSVCELRMCFGVNFLSAARFVCDGGHTTQFAFGGPMDLLASRGVGAVPSSADLVAHGVVEHVVAQVHSDVLSGTGPVLSGEHALVAAAPGPVHGMAQDHVTAPEAHTRDFGGSSRAHVASTVTSADAPVPAAVPAPAAAAAAAAVPTSPAASHHAAAELPLTPERGAPLSACARARGMCACVRVCRV
jgi:hypothetical protein